MEDYDRKVNIRAGGEELTAYVSYCIADGADSPDLFLGGTPLSVEKIEASVTDTGEVVETTDEIARLVCTELRSEEECDEDLIYDDLVQ